MRTGLRYFNIALISFCAFWVGILAALSLGLFTWQSFAVAGTLALAVGIPAGLYATRIIKRDDPHWPPERHWRRRQQHG
ncbi:hypothetical protein ACW9UR_07800 [Halovulum sp. GXIMD14794]